MTKISIGMVLGQLLKETNLSPVHIAERMGKSRQNVYLDLKRTAMRDDQVAQWAKALGIDKQTIYDHWENGISEPVKDSDSAYLIEHLTALENQFKLLQNQLEIKDRQIEKLMDLLGKLDLSESNTCQVHELRNYKMTA